jgi:hypothetical protein
MFLEPEVERQLDKVGRAESKSETREGIFEEALVKWDLLDPKFGDTISRAWVCKALGITDPDAANSVESYKEFLFNFTTLFYNGTGLRNHILKNRQRYLKTLHGEKSFEVLDPKKQTGFAQKKRHKDILKSRKRL